MDMNYTPQELASIIRGIGEQLESSAEQGLDALDLLAQLRSALDDLTVHEVANARECGASWTQVGSALGTSKQAAQQRYAKVAHNDVLTGEYPPRLI